MVVVDKTIGNRKAPSFYWCVEDQKRGNSGMVVITKLAEMRLTRNIVQLEKL